MLNKILLNKVLLKKVLINFKITFVLEFSGYVYMLYEMTTHTSFIYIP